MRYQPKTVFIALVFSLLMSWTMNAHARTYDFMSNAYDFMSFTPVQRPLDALLQPPVQTIDDLLRTCPTEAEIEMINTDFNIIVDPGVLTTESERNWTCTPGGNESSIMLTVYNVFRVMKHLQFDEPLPLIGYDNLYDWIQSLNIRIYIIENSKFSSAGVAKFGIRAEVLGSHSREWINRRTGLGLAGTIGLFVHEARHTRAGGDSRHTCRDGGNDESLEQGGSWALQYYYYQWLVHHSGSYLSRLQRDSAEYEARYILENRFCHEQSDAKKKMP